MILIAHVFSKLWTPKKLVKLMSKKSHFKGSSRKQHGKSAQTLLKIAWQHLYHIYWLLWTQLTRKKSLLVICQISGLFPNTLSAYCKCSLFNRGNLTQPIQMKVSQKQKTFSQFFAAFFKSPVNFEHFQKKKKRLSSLRYFRNYRLRNTWLHQSVKTPVSRDPLESNMVNAPKNCWNFHGSTFTIFIDHCEGNWLVKSLC